MPEMALTRVQITAATEVYEDALSVVFSALKGVSERDNKRWVRFMNGLKKMSGGDVVVIETSNNRSGSFHRRHMAIETAVFDSQERFDNFEVFLAWVKVGSGWVTWAAGSDGDLVAIPRSISFVNCEEVEFHEFAEGSLHFLRGPYAAGYLWPYLTKPDEMMDAILSEFDE